MKTACLKISALVIAACAFCLSFLSRPRLAPAAGRAQVPSSPVNSDDIDRLFRSALEESGQARMRSEQSRNADSIALAAAGLAHDVNNLLTVITGNSNLSLAEVKDPASHRRWLEVLEAGHLAKELTQQLMALSRQTILQLEAVSPNSVITSSLELLARVAGERIAIQTSLAPDAGRILINPTEFLQVLMNLVLNATDAMPAGGTVAIETRTYLQPDAGSDNFGLRPGRYEILTVTDSGKGMDEATQSRAFEVFFSTKPASQPAGLGLAIVAAIVRRSGGHVSINSRLGAGTTFHIYFPEAPQLAPQTWS